MNKFFSLCWCSCKNSPTQITPKSSAVVGVSRRCWCFPPLLVFFTYNSAVVGVFPAVVGVFHQQLLHSCEVEFFPRRCCCFSPITPTPPLLVLFTNNSCTPFAVVGVFHQQLLHTCEVLFRRCWCYSPTTPARL
jgi:hypothetical protein